jgi:acyl-CoA dehydrogenase
LLDASDDGSAACLAATEEGGAHPKAIRTRLEQDAERGYRVVGTKRWATLADAAEVLLVVVSEGFTSEGQNRLRVVRVPAKTEGVTLRRMADAPFAPELPHYELSLDVCVGPEALLPGDGYDRYLKPFRTQEDLGVLAAWTGYAIGAARAARARARARGARAATLALTVLALGEEDPGAPTTHVALAGAFDDTRRLHEYLTGAWARVGGEEAERWQRDAPLLLVAESARKARLERAWSTLGGAGTLSR